LRARRGVAAGLGDESPTSHAAIGTSLGDAAYCLEALTMIVARSLSLLSPSQVDLRAEEVGRAAPVATRAKRSSQSSGAAVTSFAALVLLAVACGWLFRDRIAFTPKSGVGYALGVFGGTAMLVLSLYPVRKNLRFMRRWGALRHWFRLHMILGVVGPVLILFHCKFHLGALNSNAALFSMLVVATSGMVGRYIYTRISHGLYGARATLDELHAELDVSAHTLDEQLPPASRVAESLAAFAMRARAPRRTIVGRLARTAALPFQAMWVRRRMLRDLRADLDTQAEHNGWDDRRRRAHEAATCQLIGTYIAALVKDVQFSAYERLFSLWHALHVPLFVMLLLAGVMHVVAVHMY